MAGSRTSSGLQYRAFISYSHQDRSWADWLHKALETYPIPKRLVGRTTAAGTIPARLAPVFRDREEFATATDLGRKVDEALARSANLIVVCSPRAAASHWVDAEVRAFKRLGRSDRIFCLIVGGEPNAGTLRGHQGEECFPAALREPDPDGPPAAQAREPIAADAREGRDGRTNAKLKLIAGLLDIGFDELKQRELQRRNRRMAAITALALLVMAVTTTLAITAVIARNAADVARVAAERRQKQAEDLVGFMLGDLGDKLGEVHRLDILQSVDDKAMAYFAALPTADVTDVALAQRVTALQKIGSVRMELGHVPAALETYQAASALAAEIAQRAPADIDRQAAYGDSLKWVGQAWWYQGDLDHALQNFTAATTSLRRPVAAKPADNDLAFDLATAETNTGRVLEARGELDAAGTRYEAARTLFAQLVARQPGETRWQSYLGDAWNSLGKLAFEQGRLDQAIAAYRTDHGIKAALAARDTANHEAQEGLLVSNAILGRLLAACGENDAALQRDGEAVASAKALMAFDPANTAWREYVALYSQQLGALLRQLGRLDAAADADGDAVRMLAALATTDASNTDWQQELAQSRLESARLELARGAIGRAREQAAPALATIRTLLAKRPDDRGSLLLASQAYAVMGRIEAQRDPNAARDFWVQARDAVAPAARSGNDPNLLAAWTGALLLLGDTDAARPLVARLSAMGYRTPDLVALAASRQLDWPDDTASSQRIAAAMK